MRKLDNFKNSNMQYLQDLSKNGIDMDELPCKKGFSKTITATNLQQKSTSKRVLESFCVDHCSKYQKSEMRQIGKLLKNELERCKSVTEPGTCWMDKHDFVYTVYADKIIIHIDDKIFYEENISLGLDINYIRVQYKSRLESLLGLQGRI